MILTETWLKDHNDAELRIEGYEIFRSDRKRPKSRFGRSSGGVAIYMREDISSHFKQIVTYSNGVTEVICLSSTSLNIQIWGIYRQPDDSSNGHPSKHEQFKPVIDLINTELDKTEGKLPDIFIAGDFNLPHANWDTKSSNPGASTEEQRMTSEIFILMNNHNLIQQIRGPTHKAGNTLDLMLTNNPLLIHSYESVPSPDYISHHSMIDVKVYFDLHSSFQKEDPFVPRNVFDEYNFHSKTINWVSIREKMKDRLWTDLHDHSTADQLTIITDWITNIIKHYIPKRKPNNKKFQKIPRDRKILFRKRKNIFRKFSNPTRNGKSKQKLIDIEIKLKQSYESEKQSQEKKATESIKNNPKFFYAYAKKHSKSKSKVGPLRDKNNSLIYDADRIANILQDQYTSVFSVPSENDVTHPTICPNVLKDIDFDEKDFIEAISTLSPNSAPGPDGFPAILLKNCKEELAKPLAIFWRNCLNHGVTEEIHKRNHITPISKGGDQGEPSNYRPVSLTSHLTKVFEKIVRKKIVEFINNNDLFNPTQHGFLEGRSCLSQLLSHYDSILSKLEEGLDVDVVYLDFSKAFDKVDHKILLSKLKSIGITDKLLKWIKSFLQDRNQVVFVDGHKSYQAKIQSGVPQGSVLGPLFFIIMISDIDEGTTKAELASFADDTRIKKGIQNIIDQFHLQNDLNNVYQWSTKNKMVLNGKKFEHLHYGNGPATSYFTGEGKIIQTKSSTRDLGVTMSDDAKFNQHILTIVEKVQILIGWILRTFSSREHDVMLTLWKSLVIPHIDNCSQLWSPNEVNLVQQIEDLQKSFTRRIKNLHNQNYWERLQTLKLFSLQRRRERYIIIYTWCIIEKLVPNPGTITFYANPRQGRKCHIPLVKRGPWQKVIYSSFKVQGPRLFNSLPKRLRDLTGCKKLKFKTELDKYLFTVPDEPLVTGYTMMRRAETNSIINMKIYIGPHRMDA